MSLPRRVSLWERLLRRLQGQAVPTPTRDDRVGRVGERIAAEALREKGYRVLARNVIVRSGEADLVCEDGAGRLVVVEVKARVRDASDSYGGGVAPEAAITARKRATLRRVAREVARARGVDFRAVRVEAVAVELEAPEGVPARDAAPETLRVVKVRHGAVVMPRT